jgi:hypothetical protein
MHRRSFILGLLASLSSAATMSLAASVEALAAERRAGNGGPAIDNWDEFSAQRRRRRRRFRFGRRRRRRGRGGGDDAPETSVGVGGSGARGGGDSILTTRKPVPLSDQAPPPAAPRPRARE